MPFVSPYQLNMMHQAAVQMALANHIQTSISRAKEGVAPPLPFHHTKPQAIEISHPINMIQPSTFTNSIARVDTPVQ